MEKKHGEALGRESGREGEADFLKRTLENLDDTVNNAKFGDILPEYLRNEFNKVRDDLRDYLQKTKIP